MGYENDQYRDEDGEPLMDFDDVSDREQSPEALDDRNRHLLDDDVVEDGEEDWAQRDRSQTPVYDNDKVLPKSKPRKRLIKKSGRESTPDFAVDEDDDQPADFVRDYGSDGEPTSSFHKRKKLGKDDDSGSRKKEKKLKKDRRHHGNEKGSASGSKSGLLKKGLRSKDQDGDPEVKEMWDTIAGGDSEVIMFLSKSDEVTTSNRKLAKDLVDKWKMDKKTEQKEEALRLKTLAEDKYQNSNIKSALKYAKRAQHLFLDLDGISEMVMAFKILRVAGKSAGTGSSPDWYKILQLEPFSHINTIKKQYKRLALTLHPDKNSFVASEEAFKLVGDAFRCLSDKIRRKEYDLKLRIAMQEAVVTVTASGGGGMVETFWTACSTCRLLHQFERRYIGHNLMCPRCKKSFLAVEVGANGSNGEGPRVETRVRTVVYSKRKMSSVDEVLERSKLKNVDEREGILDKGSSGELSARLNPERVKVGEDMTLAEMQLEAKRKVLQKKMKVKLMEEKEKGKVIVYERRRSSKRSGDLEEEALGASKKSGNSEIETRGSLKKNKDIEIERRGVLKKSGNLRIQTRAKKKRGEWEIEKRGLWKSGDFEIMAVEDSDFYDFDKDRVERSFKKGQVWAIYDDDDGMPRHYGLIDEVVSVNPFELKMSWLDLQNNGDEGLICWEKLGFHISCGRFKVAKKTVINSVNFFSHVVDIERAAREVYRIYPKKGSVWALYNEGALEVEGRNSSLGDKRCYDIVLFLTSYSEMHGLSMAYLEKVEGFKTVFKRSEIGCHAIRWLEKDDVRLFSHQIPARKMSGADAPKLLKECWELDPASLPPELLTIGWGG